MCNRVHIWIWRSKFLVICSWIYLSRFIDWCDFFFAYATRESGVLLGTCGYRSQMKLLRINPDVLDYSRLGTGLLQQNPICQNEKYILSIELTIKITVL